MELDIREHDDGISVECYVSPRSKRSSIKGLRQGALAIGLNAPPVDGKANKSLISFFSKLLKIPSRQISISKGEHNKQKVLFIQGISLSDASKIIKAQIEKLS